MQVYDVEVTPIENNTGELSDTFYRNCHFCSKIVRITPANLKSCIRLGGPQFYCPFCLRHNFHYKLADNVLIMSYRGIIGFYYWELYRSDHRQHRYHKIWHSDIVQMIEKHVAVGMQNPVLSYDPSTFLWFVDFNRIGVGKKKAPFDEIKTVSNQILQCFNLQKHISTFAEKDLWERFDKALSLFYKQRKRPKGKKSLIPTLKGLTHGTENDSFWERTRDFRPANLKIQ